jgi:septal ring factor EnvC (AmiA/AmiB activator)
MPTTNLPHRRFLSLLLATLLAGPMACDPAVSRFDMDAAQSKVDTAQTQLAKTEQELTDLQKEFKALKEFGGPDHQSKIRAAAALREEKNQLDTLKKDIDGRLDHFEKETARQRETLAKMKQP